MARERITRERIVTEKPVGESVSREKELTPRQIVLRKTTRFIWWGTAVLEGLIALRVALRMMAANPANPFANFVYALTSLFLWPFQTLTTNPAADGVVLEISSVIAMMVYLLLAWMIVEMLWLIMGRERE